MWSVSLHLRFMAISKEPLRYPCVFSTEEHHTHTMTVSWTLCSRKTLHLAVERRVYKRNETKRIVKPQPWTVYDKDRTRNALVPSFLPKHVTLGMQTVVTIHSKLTCAYGDSDLGRVARHATFNVSVLPLPHSLRTRTESVTVRCSTTGRATPSYSGILRVALKRSTL
jgi:hypothetical protein